MSNGIDPDSAAKIRVLAAPAGAVDWSLFLNSARRQTTNAFAPARMEVLEELAQGLLRHPRMRRDPAGAALAFWLRRAHLAELRKNFDRVTPATGFRVPAGLVFHIAPANVDTMFVLSWALSFLAGNANVVRLTTNTGPVVADLLECLNDVFARSPASEGNFFVTYEHDDAITAGLSRACDLRIIWGGDETIQRIRSLPLSPHAAERAFASKRSLVVFDATAYLAADDKMRATVARHLAADIAPFAQQACSSPQLLHWVGRAGTGRMAALDFSNRLEHAMRERGVPPDAGFAVRRLNYAFSAAAGGTACSMSHHPHTTTLLASATAGAETADEPCGAGLLTQVVDTSIEEIGGALTPRHQTITYWGLNCDQRTALARIAGAAGVDRVVPSGRALDFGPQWDGYELWSDLSRIVTVE